MFTATDYPELADEDVPAAVIEPRERRFHWCALQPDYGFVIHPTVLCSFWI
jgi:hypothetical protein